MYYLKCLGLSSAHVISLKQTHFVLTRYLRVHILVESLLESISLPEWGANSRRQSLVHVGVALHKGSVLKFVNLDLP